jgi:hypothetical protein
MSNPSQIASPYQLQAYDQHRPSLELLGWMQVCAGFLWAILLLSQLKMTKRRAVHVLQDAMLSQQQRFWYLVQVRPATNGSRVLLVHRFPPLLHAVLDQIRRTYHPSASPRRHLIAKLSATSMLSATSFLICTQPRPAASAAGATQWQEWENSLCGRRRTVRCVSAKLGREQWTMKLLQPPRRHMQK